MDRLTRCTAALVVLTGLALSTLSLPGQAHAATDADRFSAGGYMRIMTRPDFQGGDSRLGYWNLYGRLLNEGPYAALELRLFLLEPDPLTNAPWTSIHAKIEGDSVFGADRGQGNLSNFGLTQLYARVGNVLFEDVTWQIGTLDEYFGDLGLYDLKPAQIFYGTVGLSARYEHEYFDLLVGVGDSGYFLKGADYNTIFTAGGTLRLKLGDHVQLGVGGEYFHEPEVEGNRFAPHDSVFADGTGLGYEDYYRGEVARRFFEENPGQTDLFPDPASTQANSWKLVGHVGFGNLGPLIWNNLFVNYLRRHPDDTIIETFEGRDYTLYVTELTDERYQFNLGNEMQLRLIPDHLDLVWGVLYGYHFDLDNEIAPTDDDRTFVSTVARFQYYVTEVFHLLLESSVAQERSLQGNRYRLHADSVFTSEAGQSDARGLEFGDSDVRNTWQLKVGPVLNPLGMGIFSRPSLRILYGAQWSNQNNAFGNSFVESLSEYNDFGTVEQHWHHVVALEVETWF